jgi:hypothetical protein
VVAAGSGPYGAEVRLFVAGELDGDWTELTAGGRPAVRFAAPDLQLAKREAAGIRSERPDVAVILDVRVTVTGDFRAARAALGADRESSSVRYAGTVDGLTGLVADIELAGVADGVTLVPEGSSTDLVGVGRDVLNRLVLRGRATA